MMLRLLSGTGKLLIMVGHRAQYNVAFMYANSQRKVSLDGQKARIVVAYLVQKNPALLHEDRLALGSVQLRLLWTSYPCSD